MSNRTRPLLGTAALVLLPVLQAVANPMLERTTIDDNLTGAAFVISGNVLPGPYRKELVVSAFGEFTFGPFGPVPPAAGTVSIYRNNWRGRWFRSTPLERLQNWDRIEIVSLDDGITFPNRPTVARIKGLRKDVIVPGGYFFDSFIGNSRGSITWWENKGFNPDRWIRHDVITGSNFSYHSVAYKDFDGDHVKDMMTVAEDAGNPGDPDDDLVELQFIKGLGRGRFAAPIKVGDGGGALIVAHDVNHDGLLDIVSPQFFGPVATQPFIPEADRGARVASYVWFENNGDGTYSKWAIGTNQGPGFTITPVRNLLGDGVTRWIATNHTNPNVAFPPFSLYPEPSVYEFTPGANPRQLWSVRTLSAPGDFPVTGGIGQAAPGAADAGDINDDGRLDIAVAGDGSRAVYWMEQQPDGTFITHQLPDSDGYGQNGGPVIRDLNFSGSKEIVFSSFDQDSVSIWSH
ncbi:MAG: VCBS repeat-containing protein [Gammaproteobacteria bacterium]|nr:VCBS repeat-containing protein [Gammaproteobacteria bacterium]